MPLLPGSPAIDAGSNDLIPEGVTTDQRGQARIVNGTVDIGAFESRGFTWLVPAATARNGGGRRVSRTPGRRRDQRLRWSPSTAGRSRLLAPSFRRQCHAFRHDTARVTIASGQAQVAARPMRGGQLRGQRHGRW